MSIKLKAAWDQEYSYAESLTILEDLAWTHINESGRFKDKLAYRFACRDWSHLCDFELDYRYDDNALHLFHARQALAFIQKFEPLELGIDKEHIAWQKFQKSELDCKFSNELFRSMHSGGFCPPSDVASVLHGAQRKIARILGNLPKLEDLKFRFGPGANTSVKARASTPRWKLGAALECSANLINSASALLSEAPAWAENHAHAETSCSWLVDIKVVPGRLQFVPKNAKTFRSIVVEPVLNSFGQLGIGDYIAGRLAFAGVDITNQSRNQTLALQGSRNGSLATIDLSSASDTISKEVVASLLPLDWFTFLNQFRTGQVMYRGECIDLEKFSSMGNGFTFPLETLIFYSLAFSVSDFLHLPTGWTTSYGDDIIVPTEAVPLLVKTLAFCGFSVNLEKSFWSGPFRESCGKDYWLGFDIRPFYQKHLVSGRTLFLLHNFYMRDFDMERARRVLKWIHPSHHLYGPDGYGDGHLVGDWSHARLSRKSSERGWEGVRFDSFTLGAKRDFRPTPGDWIAPVYAVYMTGGLEDLPETDYYVVRGSKGYKRISIYTLRTNIFIES